MSEKQRYWRVTRVPEEVREHLDVDGYEVVQVFDGDGMCVIEKRLSVMPVPMREQAEVAGYLSGLPRWPQ